MSALRYRTSRARNWRPAPFVVGVREEGQRLLLTCDPHTTPGSISGGVASADWSYGGRAWTTARISTRPGELEIALVEAREDAR